MALCNAESSVKELAYFAKIQQPLAVKVVVYMALLDLGKLLGVPSTLIIKMVRKLRRQEPSAAPQVQSYFISGILVTTSGCLLALKPEDANPPNTVNWT
jgi:hypothetical protein